MKEEKLKRVGWAIFDHRENLIYHTLRAMPVVVDGSDDDMTKEVTIKNLYVEVSHD